MKCEQCGMSFTPSGRGQKYCTRECRRRAEKNRANDRMRELNAETKAMKKKPPRPAPTDWAAIGRLMAETGKSYGRLRAEGKL